MAFEPFNSVGGITVGIPPIQVINENGIATLNGLDISGLAVLGNVGNVRLYGGENGYFLQTDGEGRLTWAPAGNSGNGNGVPGGANSQVQFNDDGNFGGDAGFTYDRVNNILTVTGNIVSYNSTSNGIVTANSFSGNIVNVANIAANRITATGNLSVGNASLGNLATANFYLGNGSLLTGVTANFASYANIVVASAQPNITSLGTLTSLTITGPAILGAVGNIRITGGLAGQVLTTNGNGTLSWQSAPAAVTATYVTANYQPNITSTGTLTVLTVDGISTLGDISNVKISGGNVGYLLATDGTGNLSWQEPIQTLPGGSNTQIQFNDDNTFAGSNVLTFDKNANTLQIDGNLIANSFQLGTGIFQWSKSYIFHASTASSSLGQVLYSIPVAGVSGVEFEIMATEPAGPSRQFCKISSIYYEGVVQYNEYATLIINGGVGNYEVDYDPGDISTPPSIQLKVSPSSSNSITYKILVQVLAD